MQSLKIVTIHSDPIMQQGFQHLSQLLSLTTEVYYQASSLQEVMRSHEIECADAIIMELSGSHKQLDSNINLLFWLQQKREGYPLIVLTETKDTTLLQRLLTGAMVSVLSLHESQSEYIRLISEALQKKQVVSPTIKRVLYNGKSIPPIPEPLLTKAEMRVLEKLMIGYGVSQIAEQLCRSVKTISTHKRKIMDKFDVTTEVGLFAHLNYAYPHH